MKFSVVAVTAVLAQQQQQRQHQASATMADAAGTITQSMSEWIHQRTGGDGGGHQPIHHDRRSRRGPFMSRGDRQPARSKAAAAADNNNNNNNNNSSRTNLRRLMNHPHKKTDGARFCDPSSVTNNKNDVQPLSDGDIQGILGCGLNEYCLDFRTADRRELWKSQRQGPEHGEGEAHGQPAGICVPLDALEDRRNLQQGPATMDLFIQMSEMCNAGAVRNLQAGGTGTGDLVEDYDTSAAADNIFDANNWNCTCTNFDPTSYTGSVQCETVDLECYAVPDVCSIRNGSIFGGGTTVASNGVVSEICDTKSVSASFTSSWVGSYTYCWTVTTPFDLQYCLTYTFDGTPQAASGCDVSINGQQCNTCTAVELLDERTGITRSCLDLDCTNLQPIDQSLGNPFSVCFNVYVDDTNVEGTANYIGQTITTTKLLSQNIAACNGCNICYGGDIGLFYMTNPSTMVTIGEDGNQMTCHNLQLMAMSGDLDVSCSFATESAAIECGCTCGTKGKTCKSDVIADAGGSTAAGDGGGGGGGGGGDSTPDNAVVGGGITDPSVPSFTLGQCEMSGQNNICDFAATFSVGDSTFTLNDATLSCPTGEMNFLDTAQQQNTCTCQFGDTPCECFVCPTADRISFNCQTSIIPSLGNDCLAMDCSGKCSSILEDSILEDPQACIEFNMIERPAQDATFFKDGPEAQEKKGSDTTMFISHAAEDGSDGSVALLTFKLPSGKIEDAAYCDGKSAKLQLNHVPIEDGRTEAQTYVVFRIFGVDTKVGTYTQNLTGAQFHLFEFITSEAIRGEEFQVEPGQEIVTIDVMDLIDNGNTRGNGRRRTLPAEQTEDLYLLLQTAETGIPRVGDSFYTREDAKRGPTLSILYTSTVQDQSAIEDSGIGGESGAQSGVDDNGTGDDSGSQSGIDDSGTGDESSSQSGIDDSGTGDDSSSQSGIDDSGNGDQSGSQSGTDDSGTGEDSGSDSGIDDSEPGSDGGIDEINTGEGSASDSGIDDSDVGDNSEPQSGIDDSANGDDSGTRPISDDSNVILPYEECTVDSDGSATCSIVMNFIDVDGREIVLEAQLMCPVNQLAIFDGDFAVTSRSENACTCSALLKSSPAIDEAAAGEDPDNLDINVDDGVAGEDPSRRRQRQVRSAIVRRIQEREMDCECHICPDNLAQKHAYTCTTPIIGDCTSYDCSGACNTPISLTRIEQEETIPPATGDEVTPNDCDALTIGNFYFIFVTSIDPDEVSLFGFEDIPGGLDLFLTDNAWNGVDFESNEGILQLTTPPEGIAAGVPFGYGPNGGSGAYQFGNNWTTVASPFSLSQDGDQVFLFCLSGSGDARPLAAISYNGEFSEPGLDSYELTQSALPSSLQDEGTIVLPHEDRWEYQSKDQTLDIDVLKADIRDTNNWIGSSESGANAAGGGYDHPFWVSLTVAVLTSCYFIL